MAGAAWPLPSIPIIDHYYFSPDSLGSVRHVDHLLGEGKSRVGAGDCSVGEGLPRTRAWVWSPVTLFKQTPGCVSDMVYKPRARRGGRDSRIPGAQRQSTWSAGKWETDYKNKKLGAWGRGGLWSHLAYIYMYTQYNMCTRVHTYTHACFSLDQEVACTDWRTLSLDPFCSSLRCQFVTFSKIPNHICLFVIFS